MAILEQKQNETCIFSHIAVVGLGLVGASFCAALRKAYTQVEVVGIEVDSRTCEVARELLWVNRVYDPEDIEFESFIRQSCDLVVIAVPAEAADYYFKRLALWNYSGIITDTASTKSFLISRANKLLSHPHNYVPGHPMAGSEKNGIQGARADLFEGEHWILCPDHNTPAHHFTKLHDLITSLGARVIALPREQHDQAVAVVSHVPHIIASSLVQLMSRHADGQQALFRLAAGGFKDSTRIAAGSPELWCGIAFDNEKALLAGLSELKDIVSSFERALIQGDRARMTDLLSQAAQTRRDLPVAWVPSTEKLLEVRIPMQNHKGMVARVTTVASSVGCNIQSIEIDHVTADSAVLSLILTDEGDVGQLSTRLIDAGFSVSFNPLTAKEHTHAP